MKDVEVRLISQLMKNSRRSDRQLAKILGVSQPTITRIRTRLEKTGIIKEYTMIPDLAKLGYQLLGITLIKGTKGLTEKEFKEVWKKTIELESKNPHADLMAVNGMGLDKDVLFITFYEDYSKYSKAMTLVRELPFVNLDEIESFLVDLKDKRSYRLLSMFAIADHILTMKKA
jgi:DNA-binding Lrp family transcriptional regulator